MEIIINNIDFWNIEAARYWSFPKSTPIEERKSKAREMCLSTRYLGARKMDGAWNMIIKDLSGNFHLRSRKESVNGGFTDKAEWIPQITKELNYLPNGTVLIGEIYLPNDEGSRKITSILNCLKDKSLSRQKEKPLHFYVFDIIAYGGEAINNKPFEQRIAVLNQLKESTYVQIAEYKEGAELWELYHNVLEQGGEGIVITRKDYTYEFGKRTAWKTLKMKKELQDTIDAFIDGAYKPATQQYNGKAIDTWNYWFNQKTQEKLEGQYYQEYVSGKPIIPVTKAWFNDWASAISFSVYKENGEAVHIGYISGITDEVKRDIVFAPEKLIYKVAELTAMEIEKIDGHYSLRHGRILQFRDDKLPKDCFFEQIVNSKN